MLLQIELLPECSVHKLLSLEHERTMDRNVEIRSTVRQFLQTDPIYRGLLPANFGDDFNLVESGALDSIGIFNLVSFLEKEFGVSIEPQDLNDTYFGTLASIEVFVASRRK